MSNVSNSHSHSDFAPLTVEQSVVEERSPDLPVAVCGLLFICGLYVDGWAHFHGHVDESFFTPYHALLYGSFFVTALVLAWFIFLEWKRTKSLWAAIPGYYGIAIVGVLVFAIGGLADMAWHTVFGIEEDVEALISPSHLVLALGGAMLVLAPLRAAWFRPKSILTTSQSLPIILTGTTFLSLLTFFTVYLHPMTEITAIRDYRRWDSLSTYAGQQVGMASTMLQAALIAGLLLFIATRWRWSLPFGAFTAILTINASLMSILRDQHDLILAYLTAGLIGDLLVRLLQPATRLRDVRLIAFLIPFCLTVSYHLLLMQRGGFDWSFPMWSGASVIAGLIGYLMSILISPSPAPIAANQ